MCFEIRLCYKCFSCVTLGQLFYLSVYIKDNKSTYLIGFGES